MPKLTFERSAAILFFIAVAFAACFTPAQNDTWWHLRAGEQTWMAGGVQLTDTFSHTAFGAYWPNQEWLGEVVLYGLYRAGGLPLMTAFAAGLIVASWLLVWRLTPGPVMRRVLLCAMAVMCSSREWSLRPKIFTLACIALTLFLLARRRYFWLPALFVLWANLHAGVMLGVVIVTAWLVGDLRRERRLTPAMAWVAIGCVLATAATPLGVSLWTEIAASMSRIRQYGIHEWAPPRVTDVAFAPFWLMAAALVALTVDRKPWRRGADSPPMLLAALAMLPFACSASRNVAPAMLATVPALGALLERRFPSAARSRAERPRLNAALVAASAVAAAALVAQAWSAHTPHLGWDPIPAGAIQAVATCPDPLYNRYDEGGFLIWFARTKKVFIDGRQDPFPAQLMLDHLRTEASGDYRDLFGRYGIRCAFLPSATPVAVNLAASGWRRSYADPDWTVFVRP